MENKIVPSYDYKFHVILIGDSEVGKSFLVSTFHELDPNRKRILEYEKKEI
jgi:hypothetical protein